MDKKTSLKIGLLLILGGAMALGSRALGTLFGFRIWDLWPLIVIAAGAGFIAPALLNRDNLGLGGLYIPGIPTLTTGVILLLASLFHYWDIWSWLWPLELLGVALGFLFAAFHMGVIWLLVPAILIGANGLLMQFCAITGWWGVWSLLWIIEPLSIALALFIANLKQQSTTLQTACIALCALAGIGFIESLAIIVLSAFFPVWRLWRWMGAMTLILSGCFLLIRGGLPTRANLAAER